MTRRLRHVSPLPVGKIFGIIYAIFGLIFVPFFAIAALVGAFAEPANSGAGAVGVVVGMIVMAVLLPVLYGAMGFVGGIICAALYNLIARWVSGLDFQVGDVPATTAETSVQPT